MPTRCVEYTGSLDKDGYGRRDLKRFASNRLPRQIMEMVYGAEAIKGKVVMHTCDNPPCFRFDHLVLGTVADNNADRLSKGRHHYAKRTHCNNGHEFTPENTATRTNGARKCRICQNAAAAKYWRKVRGRGEP